MLQRLLRRDPLCRIVDKYSLEQVQELSIKVRRRWYYFLFGSAIVMDTRHELTWSFFMALTYFREFRGVS